LTSIPSRLDLGRLAPGQPATATVAIENPHASPITVTRVEVSCDCVHIRPERWTVPARGASTIRVTYEPEDATFAGHLDVSITGVDDQGKAVFRESVAIRVEGGAR